MKQTILARADIETEPPVDKHGCNIHCSGLCPYIYNIHATKHCTLFTDPNGVPQLRLDEHGQPLRNPQCKYGEILAREHPSV